MCVCVASSDLRRALRLGWWDRAGQRGDSEGAKMWGKSKDKWPAISVNPQYHWVTLHNIYYGACGKNDTGQSMCLLLAGAPGGLLVRRV
jgi:hypothetical protein